MLSGLLEMYAGFWLSGHFGKSGKNRLFDKKIPDGGFRLTHRVGVVPCTLS